MSTPNWSAEGRFPRDLVGESNGKRMATEKTTLVKRSPRATYRRIGEEEGAVLLHLDTAQYHGVNEIGALVWDLLEEPIDFGDLIERLNARIENPPAELVGDVEEFLEALAERDLVVLQEP